MLKSNPEATDTKPRGARRSGTKPAAAPKPTVKRAAGTLTATEKRKLAARGIEVLDGRTSAAEKLASRAAGGAPVAKKRAARKPAAKPKPTTTTKRAAPKPAARAARVVCVRQKLSDGTYYLTETTRKRALSGTFDTRKLALADAKSRKWTVVAAPAESEFVSSQIRYAPRAEPVPVAKKPAARKPAKSVSAGSDGRVPAGALKLGKPATKPTATKKPTAAKTPAPKRARKPAA